MSLFHSKVKDVRNWFKEHVTDDDKPYFLDPHQAAIVLDNHKNCLVTARAGSGKTRTVVAKIVYLIAHEKVHPEEIIVFAFNRKARAEINERLLKIKFDGENIVNKPVKIATTFHAFAFHLLDDGTLKDRLISEDFENKLLKTIVLSLSPDLSLKNLEKLIQTAAQFIARAEQFYFEDYAELDRKIENSANQEDSSELELLNRVFRAYREYLKLHDLLDFNQLLVLAAKKLNEQTPYRYIFIDEYQDFSKLFLRLITSLRKTCEDSHLLAVGDDWQAINGFAGSDVRYFKNFRDYFPEDCAKLFIPTNYRSGKRIVKCANYFMASSLKDYQDCKTGNKLSSHIHLINLQNVSIPPSSHNPELPLSVEQVFFILEKILEANPNKSIKILARNNDLSSSGWSLESFVEKFVAGLEVTPNLDFSTIHRSKGLEADVVVLLEIDAGVFPKSSKDDPISSVFNESKASRLDEEKRLFYVALTRPKQELYILTSTPPKGEKFDPEKPNFLSLLNPNWLEDF